MKGENTHENPVDLLSGLVNGRNGSPILKDMGLRFYWHVMRRDGDSDERRVPDMEVRGRRRRGRPKTIWKDGLIKLTTKKKGEKRRRMQKKMKAVGKEDEEGNRRKLIVTKAYCRGGTLDFNTLIRAA